MGYESENESPGVVRWGGVPMQAVTEPELVKKDALFFTQCIVGSLHLAVGDFVLINLHRSGRNLIENGSIGEIIYLFEESTGHNNSCRAYVRWYLKCNGLPNNIKQNKNYEFNFDCEVVQDFRPFDQDILIETIVSKCWVFFGKSYENPKMILNQQKSLNLPTQLMYACRYKFVRAIGQTRYKMEPCISDELSDKWSNTIMLSETAQSTVDRNNVYSVVSNGKKKNSAKKIVPPIKIIKRSVTPNFTAAPQSKRFLRSQNTKITKHPYHSSANSAAMEVEVDEHFVLTRTSKSPKKESKNETPKSSARTPSSTRKLLRDGGITPKLAMRQHENNRRKSDIQLTRARLHVSAAPKSHEKLRGNGNFKWSPNNTRCLIQEFITSRMLFSLSLKKDVWNNIAGQVSNLQNKKFTGEQCAKKWSSLRLTYIKLNGSTNDNINRNWEFFNLMDEALNKGEGPNKRLYVPYSSEELNSNVQKQTQKEKDKTKLMDILAKQGDNLGLLIIM